MGFGIQYFVCVFFALMMMMSISPNTIDRPSGGNENKLATATRLVKVGINDYQEPGASIKHRPAPPGDEVGGKIQDYYQEPSSTHKHVPPPEPTNEDGLA